MGLERDGFPKQLPVMLRKSACDRFVLSSRFFGGHSGADGRIRRSEVRILALADTDCENVVCE